MSDHDIPSDETLAREYLANERTLLAWVRTGMNSIGIGVLLYIFVGAVRGLPNDSPLASVLDIATRSGEFEIGGLALVVFGALVQVVALGRFVQYRLVLRRGESTSSVGVYLLIVFGFLLLGLAYIGYAVIA